MNKSYLYEVLEDFTDIVQVGRNSKYEMEYNKGDLLHVKAVTNWIEKHVRNKKIKYVEKDY